MPHAPDLSGHALDARYELHELIGEGAFGRVYRGHDRRLARPVAVKVIKPWWSEDPDWVRTFEREAQLLARVNDPGIVQIYDVGQAAEGTYYVAELVDGESLAERLGRGAVPPWEACELATQLCLALAQAHAQGVVHRDVKPANVLISAGGRVKVGDFGVALLAEGSSDDAMGTVVGTPRYMAPEQAQGRAPTPATDVYSVGVVLYEMLSGQPPFVGSSSVELALQHLQDPPAPLGGDVPAALGRIVFRALAKRPEERYATAGAMAEALKRAARVGDEHGTARSRGRGATSLPAGSDARRPRSVRRLHAPDAGTESADEPGATSVQVARERPSGRSRRGAAPGAGDERRPPRTRIAPRLTPRRNVNPSARRRTAALFAAVLALLLAMAVGAVLLAAPATVRVPDLRGLSRAAATARAGRVGLHPSFVSRFNRAPRGLVVAQHPGTGTKASSGAAIDVVLSAGPPPVKVPQLDGGTSADAQTMLSSLGLRTSITAVPAPGVSPGTVIHQSPGAAAELVPGSTVSLSVAETPQWRTVTSVGGDGPGQSAAFRIRGNRWRIVYSLGYDGTCTFIFICSGPSAHITTLSGGSSPSGFDLNEGQNQTQEFDSGAGVYQVAVSPGSDSAHWSMRIEDYY
jgi:serine/threonine-protein kinase